MPPLAERALEVGDDIGTSNDADLRLIVSHPALWAICRGQAFVGLTGTFRKRGKIGRDRMCVTAAP